MLQPVLQPGNRFPDGTAADQPGQGREQQQGTGHQREQTGDFSIGLETRFVNEEQPRFLEIEHEVLGGQQGAGGADQHQGGGIEVGQLVHEPQGHALLAQVGLGGELVQAQADEGSGAEQINQHLFPFTMVEADRKGFAQQGEHHDRQGIGQGPTAHVGHGPLQGSLPEEQQGHHGDVQGAEGNADAKQGRLGHQGGG